uniref:chondrosarcoma-associated gene 2/3 protein-like n=1 Tax=Callithrix jacchus TaxID=9483 RepID=UPI0023DD3C2F|nr:chondrosarcoma-associated gene 2/3 protein-like [Callithrix jacchus]
MIWMGFIQSVEGVKMKDQGFLEKEFYHKTNITMLCSYQFTVPVASATVLRDARVVKMARKPRASSPGGRHLPTPKKREKGRPPLNPGPEALSRFPGQPGRQQEPFQGVPGKKKTSP